MTTKEQPRWASNDLDSERQNAGTKLTRSDSKYGAWVASLVIGAGLVLASAGAEGLRVANAGIDLLIILPVSRLLLMVIVFLRDRDYRLALAAILVLTIILAGVTVGIRTAAAPVRLTRLRHNRLRLREI